MPNILQICGKMRFKKLQICGNSLKRNLVTPETTDLFLLPPAFFHYQLHSCNQTRRKDTRSLSPREEVVQISIANRPQFCPPFDLCKLRLVKDIALAEEADHGSSLVHQDVFCSHAAASLKCFFIVADFIRVYNIFCEDFLTSAEAESDT